MEDKREFTIFRHVSISTKQDKEPIGLFIVRFKPASMTYEQNIKFSRIPMMVFMGFKGFRSKFWCVDKVTGLCQGFYKWQTVKDAKNYSKSIAMKFMTRRSYPDSVEYEIIDLRKKKYHMIVKK